MSAAPRPICLAHAPGPQNLGNPDDRLFYCFMSMGIGGVMLWEIAGVTYYVCQYNYC